MAERGRGIEGWRRNALEEREKGERETEREGGGGNRKVLHCPLKKYVSFEILYRWHCAL